MGDASGVRLLTEREIEGRVTASSVAKGPALPSRSVTVNIAESPLGWLFARGHLSRRQFDAGERVRSDWERAQLAPRVTMAWDSAPVSRDRGGATALPDLTGAQIDAKRRFHDAVLGQGAVPLDTLDAQIDGWIAAERARTADPGDQRASPSKASA